MKIAVIATSRKENEKRIPIHPDHIKSIPLELRKNLYFEKGYGLAFGMDDETIFDLTNNKLLERDELFKTFKAIIITKPTIEDFEEMQEYTLVWGWIHSVQQSEITQIAIEKKLTLIAWENMNYQGSRDFVHIFNKNNELAGYCGVQHSLELLGIDGLYGPDKKVIVISQGSVSRGALFALKGHGFNDITVYTQRPSLLVSSKIPGVTYKQILNDEDNVVKTINLFLEKENFIDQLLSADIIVNGMLQDPNNPITFMTDKDIDKVKKPCLIIDISCDEGMGFSFAKPTSFQEPILKFKKVSYYAVDHTPSLMWNSASWEISKCIFPYLKCIINGDKNQVIEDAIDIKEGIVINQDIIAYQNRLDTYPYKTK